MGRSPQVKRWLRATGCGAVFLAGTLCLAQRFYPDDPIWREPPPANVKHVEPHELNRLADFYKNTAYRKGERNSAQLVYPSIGVNTLGEVPDSSWFTNRIGHKHMSRAELVRGANVNGPPDPSKPWKIIAAKAEGVSPGFSIEDSQGRRYLLKFDVKSNPELATGAEVITAKFLHALGYNVPEEYIVNFRREQIEVPAALKFKDSFGRLRVLRVRDVEDMLNSVAASPDGTVRAVASRHVPGELLGGFKYYKRRGDDPNELGPHEHLRVLRGLSVFCAWLNHTDAKALNSLDSLVDDESRRYVKHYLIDFGASLGSDSIYAKDPRLGHECMWAAKPGLVQLLTLGAAVPRYARIDYPGLSAVGNFTAEGFEPDKWKPNYPNAAFANRLPGDAFWAAKKLMAFSDDDIRAVVETGEYSDPEAARLISDALISRRDAIGRVFFAKMLPVDNFRVEKNRLLFDDLATEGKLAAPRKYSMEWARFDNQSGGMAPLGKSGPDLPPELRQAAPGTYWAATVQADDPSKAVKVFLLKSRGGWTVAGIERGGANRWEPL